MTRDPRHTGHPIALVSYREGVIVCACGWRSVRGLGCGELDAAYRGHRREAGAPVVNVSGAAESKRWRYA